MTIAHLLEDFTDAADPGNVLRLLSDVALEDIRLASFEQGYSAGWDDAIAAQDREQHRIAGELARNLEDLSFTYQEAMTQFAASVEPVFSALVDLVLPDILRAATGPRIVELLTDAAREGAAGPAVLYAAPGDLPALHAVLERDLPVPVRVVEDAGLAPSQVRLGIGAGETELDAEALQDAIRRLLGAFTHQTREEIGNG